MTSAQNIVIRNGVWQANGGLPVDPRLAERMLEAVQRVDVAEVEELLAQGFPVTNLPILSAIATRSIRLFQTFFDYGWDVNSLFRQGNPPALAYVLDDQALTQWFLDHGADPNARCHLDFTPMSVAVAVAPFSAIQLLFKNNGSADKGQLLWHAVNRQREDVFPVLDLLLSLGAPLNEVKYARHEPSFVLHRPLGLCTPLHRAVDLKRADIVGYLVERGANPDIQSTSKKSAFDEAIALGDEKVLSAMGRGAHQRPSSHMSIYGRLKWGGLLLIIFTITGTVCFYYKSI